METENKDWKPEVGKHVWVVENYMILQKKVLRVDPSLCCLLRGRRGDDFYEGFKCYPTPEAALASIKIYDLEGKEVVIPRARSIFNGKDFNWMLRDELGQTSGLPRAQDKIIIEMCDRAAEQIANLSEWDDSDYAQLGMAPIINAFKEIIAVRDRAAIKMVAKLVYEMNLPENPEGEARLKAAQERFNSAIGGKSDQREGGC